MKTSKKNTLITEALARFDEFTNNYITENGDEVFIAEGFHYHERLKAFIQQELQTVIDKSFEKINRIVQDESKYVRGIERDNDFILGVERIARLVERITTEREDK